MALRVHDIVDRPKAQVRLNTAYTLRLKAYLDGVQRTNVAITGATISITTPGGAPLPVPVVDAVVTVAAGGDMSYLLAGANAAQLGARYRAIWTYTDTGIVYQHVQLFDVVRHPLYAVVIQADLVKHHPDLADTLFSGQTTFNTDIEEAFEDVYRVIENLGPRPALLLSSEELRRPTEHRALARIFNARKKKSDDRWAELAAQHQKSHDDWLAGQTFAYDEDDDGVISEEEAKRAVGQFAYRV